MNFSTTDAPSRSNWNFQTEKKASFDEQGRIAKFSFKALPKFDGLTFVCRAKAVRRFEEVCPLFVLTVERRLK